MLRLRAALDYDRAGLCPTVIRREIDVKKNACSFAALTFAALAAAALWSDGLLAGEPLGTAEQARAMLDRAVVALKANQATALSAFNDAHNKDFHDRDLFVYCFNAADGKFTAYEIPPLIGVDIRQFKLYNEPMGQRSYDIVHDAPEGAVVTIDYRMPKPSEAKPSAKQALEARVGTQACGVSYFK
jgi:cytochrome c